MILNLNWSDVLLGRALFVLFFFIRVNSRLLIILFVIVITIDSVVSSSRGASQCHVARLAAAECLATMGGRVCYNFKAFA